MIAGTLSVALPHRRMLMSLFKPLLALILAATLSTGPRVQIALFASAMTIPVGAMQEEEEHRHGHSKVARAEHRTKERDPQITSVFATFERICPTQTYRCPTITDSTGSRQLALLAALSGQLRC